MKHVWPILVAAGLAISACTSGHDAEEISVSPESSVERPAGVHQQPHPTAGQIVAKHATNAWDNLPTNMKLPGVTRSLEYASWGQLMGMLPETDRELLARVNHSYYGALTFSSEEELSRLVSEGYPLPEEWLAADRLTNTELEAIAREGNVKAQMLYADRMASDVAGEIVGLDDPFVADPAIDHDKVKAVSHAAMVLRQSDGSFAALLWGRTQSIMTQRIEPVAAAMLVAGGRGDRRSAIQMKELEDKYQSIDMSLVHLNYATIASAQRREI